MITQAEIEQWRNDYNSDKTNYVLENVISNNSISKIDQVRKNNQSYDPVYNHNVKPEMSITDQKSSGRCWLFAALNVIRRQVATKYNLSDFELSQNYLFFWDKLERMNYNLECIIKTKAEPVDSRIVQHLLDDPTCDGGQWDMIANLINKHGLVPKSAYNESYHSSNSRDISMVLKKKFREYACLLRSSDSPQEDKKKYMKEVYGILCKFLGSPPTNFNWEFIDKDKKYNFIKNLTPITFYKEHCNFNVDDYVCLINDPRNEYNKLYTVEYLGNVLDGNKVLYLNVDIQKIKDLTVKSIKANEAVWFGCDVGQNLCSSKCAMDFDQVDYLSLFNTGFSLDKKQRIQYRHSLMTHAMVFTGVNIQECENCLEEQGVVKNWKVENSWGGRGSMKGYYSMSDQWFSEFTYEIAINKKYMSEEDLKLLESKEITTFPPWDPMGALA